MQKRLSVLFDGWFVKRLEAPVVLDLDSPSVFKRSLVSSTHANKSTPFALMHSFK